MGKGPLAFRRNERGCWLPNRKAANYGYVQVEYDHTRILLHRLVYETLVGPVLDGCDLHHAVCHTKACCNPWHVVELPHREHAKLNRLAINNRSKTHCPKGHEYSPENTYVGKRGGRLCRTCMRIRSAQHQAKRAPKRTHKRADPAIHPNSAKTHCPHGHEYTPDNTMIHKRGYRVCRACKRISNAHYRHRLEV